MTEDPENANFRIGLRETGGFPFARMGDSIAGDPNPGRRGPTMEDRERELFDLLEPEVGAQGVDLVDVAIVPAGSRRILRLVIYSAGGISHGDCARATRACGDILEERETVPGEFILEVSSPGMDRKLKDSREFELFKGRRVKVWQTDGETYTEIAGTCAGTREDGSVVLRTDDGGESTIPWSSVTKARLVPDTPEAERAEGRMK